MTKPYVHSPTCSGCPECSVACARVLAMKPAELGEYYAAHSAAMGAGSPNRVLRTASAGTMRTTGAAPACGCGGEKKKRNGRLLAEARALTGREDLAALTDAALIEIIADAVVAQRALAVPCTYGLPTPRAAADVIDWSGRGEPGSRVATTLTEDEQRVYTHPPDAYGLEQLDRARETTNRPTPAMRAAAGELPQNWSVTNPGDAYGLEALEQHRQAALRGEVAA